MPSLSPETADLRHRTRTPHGASGRSCSKTRIHRQRTHGDSWSSSVRNDHSGGPDAGSRIDGGPGTLARRWADLGARSRDQARELDPPPLSPWTLDRQRSWTLVCAAPDGGFRRLENLFRVSSADGSSTQKRAPAWRNMDSPFRIYDFRTKIGSGRIPDSGSTIFERKLARAGLRIQDLRFPSPPSRSNEPPTYPG